jgi:hypothetical protein
MKNKLTERDCDIICDALDYYAAKGDKQNTTETVYLVRYYSKSYARTKTVGFEDIKAASQYFTEKYDEDLDAKNVRILKKTTTTIIDFLKPASARKSKGNSK